ncbi:hypothetical protein ACFRAK_27845, partial [Peribacillus sp. NPDC056705]
VSWVLDGDKLHSSAGWSPYHGLKLQGKVTSTIVRGVTVYDNDTVTGQPGHGEFVRATHKANESEGGMGFGRAKR